MNGTRICQVPECERKHIARGLCALHYKHARKSKSLDEFPPVRVSDVAARMAKHLVPMPSGCIEWGASRFAQGYGQIKIDYKNRKTHRVAWELAHGPIPKGMMVCHKCDNPPCCNVEHLFLGTARENTQDMVSKGRRIDVNGAKTHCRRGHEYTPENTYIIPTSGSRACRSCDKAHQKARWAREKASRR